MSRREVMKVRVHRGVMGSAQITIGGTSFYWNGPGSGQLHPIEHPSASGSYLTLRDAKAAARRFMGGKYV